jgi:hypothetical protein
MLDLPLPGLRRVTRGGGNRHLGRIEGGYDGYSQYATSSA